MLMWPEIREVEKLRFCLLQVCVRKNLNRHMKIATLVSLNECLNDKVHLLSSSAFIVSPHHCLSFPLHLFHLHLQSADRAVVP